MNDNYLLTTEGYRKIPSPCLKAGKHFKPSKESHDKENASCSSGLINDKPLSVRKKKPAQSIRKSFCLEKYKPNVFGLEKKSRCLEETNAEDLNDFDAKNTVNDYAGRTQLRRYEGLIHKAVYTVRSQSCTPLQMYLHDDVRNFAKQRGSHEKRCQSADTVYRFRRPLSLPPSIKHCEFLHHEDFTMGEKQYIWGIARCYSVDEVRQANLKRNQKILDYELQKRLITKNISNKTKIKLWKDHCDYTAVIHRLESKSGASRPQSSFTRRVLYGNSLPLGNKSTKSATILHKNQCCQTEFNKEMKDSDWLKPSKPSGSRPKSARLRLSSPSVTFSHVENELLNNDFEQLIVSKDSNKNS